MCPCLPRDSAVNLKLSRRRSTAKEKGREKASRRIQHRRNHLTARLTVNDLSPCGAGSVDCGPCPVLGVAAAQRSVGMRRGFGVRQARVCALAWPHGCRPSGFRETAGQDPEPSLCLAAQERCHPSGQGLGSPQGGRGAVWVEGSFRPTEAVASP